LKHLKQNIFLCLLAFLTLSSLSHAENVTLDVYPSEQELYEAYLRGEIDYQTYLNLNEIFEDGIDSTDLYLLEEIPNVNYFLESIRADYSDLELEQAETYILGETEGTKTTGYFRGRLYRKLEEDGDDKDFFTLESKLNENWKMDIRYSENYSGDKKWSRRSLVYQSDRGPVSKMILGNFTARFGLGLTAGYRGKLFGKSDDSFDESFLFPDYGGFNGIYIEGEGRGDAVRLLMHYDQNGEYSFGAGVLNYLRKYRDFRFEVMVQGGILENRATSVRYKHYQFGAFAGIDRRKFKAAFEVAVPKDETATVPTMLFETMIKSEPVTLKASAWNYTEDFINLTGGGRAGSMRTTIIIDTIDFELRDKRIDQKGMLLKSNTELGYNFEHELTLSAYGTSKYRQNFDLVSSFVRVITNDMKLRFSYRYARREEPGQVSTKNEYRLEGKYAAGIFDFKNYIEYTDDLYEHEYLSFYARVRGYVDTFGRLDLWLNFDKIDHRDGRFDYFYGYISETAEINNRFEFGAKYSYRYSRSSSDSNESQVMIETKVKW